MKTVIILNGISRKKGKFYQRILPPLQQANDITILETQHAGHAFELAKAAAQNFELVLAAGGDGTLNQVLNGVLTSGTSTLPAIGIIPLGTGNDFARVCGMAADGKKIADLLKQSPLPLTDVGKIFCHDDAGKNIQQYFINVCSLGMGPEVVRRLGISNRTFGPAITYLKAITQTFFTHTPQPVSVQSEKWEWSGLARVVAIANGKSFGNGLYVGPDAEIADGMFSAFIASDVPLVKFLLYLQTIKGGRKLKDDKIHYHQTTSVHVTSTQKTVLEAEGELQGYLPATIAVMPSAIRFLR